MSTYSGHVEPDGERSERRDGRLLLRKFSVGEMDNNVYVIADAETREALVVDAAARADRIREEIADLEPIAVVQTHGHWDHVRAWGDLVADPGLPVWGHPADAELFPAPVDRELRAGDTLAVGGLQVEVLHTPGHTDGALQFLVQSDARPHLISGDSLFPGGPGNTWDDPDRFERLMTNLEQQVFGRLPDETWVYPGHGDDTTLGVERPKLPEWRERGW
ncbi:MAG TPA: MBL fold metallo-hydrolase [Nitriliruptorales bacterium]